MANIILTLDHTIQDGEDIKFKAPCACSEVEGITVNYPVESGDGTIGTETKTFTFRDTHGNDLTGLGNLFSEGAYVKVIVDTENGHAYLQNADTNGYLEEKLGSGGGSGWTELEHSFSTQANARLIGWNGLTKTFREPITIPTDGLVEFELEVFGVANAGVTGFLTLVDESGSSMGKLRIDGSNYSAHRKSNCIVNWNNAAGVYSYEIEDYVSGLQNYFSWSKSASFTRASSLTIVGYKWEATTEIMCLGYTLKYRILE